MDRESEFYTDPSDYNKKSTYNRLALFKLQETTSSTRLTLAHLLEHGMKGAPQGALNLSHPSYAELLKYIEENF
jgi:hypothetical protein